VGRPGGRGPESMRREVTPVRFRHVQACLSLCSGGARLRAERLPPIPGSISPGASTYVFFVIRFWKRLRPSRSARTYYLWVEPTDYGATIRSGDVLPEHATKSVHADAEGIVTDMHDAIASRHDGCLAFPTIAAAEAALADEERVRRPNR
jgi:hypothetical protein